MNDIFEPGTQWKLKEEPEGMVRMIFGDNKKDIKGFERYTNGCWIPMDYDDGISLLKDKERGGKWAKLLGLVD